LASIDDDEALHALLRLFRTEALDSRIRRLALDAICKNPSPVAVQLLQNLAASHGALAEIVRGELKKINPV